VGFTAGWQYAVAAGWIAAAVVFLVWTWASIAPMDGPMIERLVHQRHLGRRLADTLVVVASIASLSGVGFLLGASNVKGPDKTITAGLGLPGCVLRWLVVPPISTVRYAVNYYPDPWGGINLTQDESPAVSDFAYLAFTVAATYGVTDTALQNRQIRIV